MAGLPKSEAMSLFLFLFFVSTAFLFTVYFLSILFSSTAVRVVTTDRVSTSFTFLQNPFEVGYLPTQNSFCRQNLNTLSSKTFKGLADSLRILTPFFSLNLSK